MAKRKYLSLERLTDYDTLIKGKIADGDAATLASAKSYVDGLVVGGHNHDDRYYTETEIDSKLSTVNNSISNITNGTTPVKEAEHATSADNATEANHATSADSATKATQDGNGKEISSTYETKSDASAKLTEAKGYTDTKVSGLASTSDVTSAISTHNTSSDAHSDIRDVLAEVKADVDAFFKDATISEAAKDTLKEIQDYITSDASAAQEMLDAIAGKADEEHGHAISDVTNLQSTLDEKAKQTDLDTHATDAVKHITATERTNWNAAKTHADSAHAPVNAQENVIESIKVNGTVQTITSKSVNITVPTTPADINAAPATHGHAISEITDLQTTLNNAASAIGANISSIDAHNTRILALEGLVGEGFEEITSDEIQALFK